MAFKFGIDYSMAAVWRLLHRHGWAGSLPPAARWNATSMPSSPGVRGRP
ncbi:winged helix-turn-helix domain-containing protein [Streptomyces sp. RG80]